MDQNAQINKLHRQQTALADFGTVAFQGGNFQAIIDRAAAICADLLEAPYCTINRFRFDSNDLLIVAGFGLEADVVGKAVSKADRSSGAALNSTESCYRVSTEWLRLSTNRL